MKTFVIGRDPDSQIMLNDKLVSRRHAQLTFLDSGQAIIKDLGSINGTFVNGNRITESYLNAGDIVKCGSLFLDWAQYINAGHATSQPMNNQHSDPNAVNLPDANLIALTNQYSVKDTFRYLITGIFEIGDLFKTSWDRTSSILFLKGIPVGLTFIASVIVFTKYRDAGFYFSPTALAVLLFGVSPFITMYLLSLNKKVQIDKVALASGIIGFIQFSVIFCIAVDFWISYQHLSADYGNFFANRFQSRDAFDFFNLATSLLCIVLLINLAIALYLFIYKYFISIGITRSTSIYLIIVTVSLNAFFQTLSAYFIYLIVRGGNAIF